MDDASEFVSGRGDSFRSTELALHPAIKLTKVVLGVVETLSATAKRNSDAILHLSSACVKNLASADPFLRAKTEPGCERRCVSEAGHIGADLTDNRMRGNDTDARDISKVNTDNSVQFTPQIEGGFILLAFGWPPFGRAYGTSGCAFSDVGSWHRIFCNSPSASEMSV